MNNTIPNSSTVTATSVSIMTNANYVAYTILGSLAILLNLLLFAVLISDKALLRRSSLLAGIALGNLQLGIYLAGNGIYRLVYVSGLQVQTTLLNCTSIIWPLTYSLAFNTEASFLFLGGLERFLAIAAAHWFRQKWTNRTAWFLAIGAYVSIWLILSLTLVWPMDRSALNWQCSLSTIYGNTYLRFSSFFSCIGGLSSATLTVSALILCIRRVRNLPLASGEVGRARKQLQLTKSMATISCFEIALMAIPNFISLLGNFRVPLPSFIIPANSTYTNAVNAFVAYFASMAFNSQFRQAAIKLLHAGKVASKFSKVLATCSMANKVAATTLLVRSPAEASAAAFATHQAPSTTV